MTSAFSEETLAEACQNLAKRPSPFPPSAGEIFSECERLSDTPKESAFEIAWRKALEFQAMSRSEAMELQFGGKGVKQIGATVHSIVKGDAQ